MRRTGPHAFKSVFMVIFLSLSSCMQDDGSLKLKSLATKRTTSSTPNSLETAPTFAVTPPSSTFYVGPRGTGTLCSSLQPCSLETAQVKVQQLTTTTTNNLIVYLMDGVYDRAKRPPLNFTAKDSGKNGNWVSWKAVSGAKPVLDGGLHLNGWAPVPGLSGVWMAQVPVGFKSRDLWVNGDFRQRASGVTNPVGWTFTYNGINTGTSNYSYMSNQSTLEVVGFSQWKMFRCPVVSISDNFITMAQPCWRNAIDSGCHKDWGLKAVSWLENSADYIRTQGSWYLDSANGRVLYTPYPGEDLATANVVLGASQKLVDISNADNLVFEGIWFVNTTYTDPFTGAPGSVDGYVSLQSGVRFTGYSCASSRIPGMIDIVNSRKIVFLDNIFARSGSHGIATDEKSNSTFIRGNGFYSTGAAGIAIGGPGDGTISSGTIQNNLLFNTGRHYWDIAALTTGYLSNSSAIHNHIENTYYSGVSWGWGWGNLDGPNLNFSNNLLRKTMKGPFNDGGAIYSNQTSTGGVIGYNWVDDIGSYFGPMQFALYLDGGEKQSTFYNRFDINGNFSGARSAMINSGGNSITYTYTTVPQMDLCDQRVPTNCKYPGGNYVGNMSYYPNAPQWADALTREGCTDSSCAGLQKPYMYLRSLKP